MVHEPSRARCSGGFFFSEASFVRKLPAQAGTGDPDPGAHAGTRVLEARGLPEGTARAIAVHQWQGEPKRVRFGGALCSRAPRHNLFFDFGRNFAATVPGGEGRGCIVCETRAARPLRFRTFPWIPIARSLRAQAHAGGEEIGYFTPPRAREPAFNRIVPWNPSGEAGASRASARSQDRTCVLIVVTPYSPVPQRGSFDCRCAAIAHRARRW